MTEHTTDVDEPQELYYLIDFSGKLSAVFKDSELSGFLNIPDSDIENPISIIRNSYYIRTPVGYIASGEFNTYLGVECQSVWSCVEDDFVIPFDSLMYSGGANHGVKVSESDYLEVNDCRLYTVETEGELTAIGVSIRSVYENKWDAKCFVDVLFSYVDNDHVSELKYESVSLIKPPLEFMAKAFSFLNSRKSKILE